MSEIIYVIPRHDDTHYEQLILPSIKKMGGSQLQMFNDSGKIESVFSKYQSAVDAIKTMDLSDNDIVAFVHEDIGLVDPLLKEKLDIIFNRRPDVGLVGVVGTAELNIDGGWWMGDQSKLRGHIVQGNDKGIGQGFYLKKGPVGFFDDVVAIDGCIMFSTVKIVREVFNFDLDYFSKYNDFYDLELSMQILRAGYKIAVADIMVFHQSMGKGSLTPAWHEARDVFVQKCASLGYDFPITTKTFEAYHHEHH